MTRAFAFREILRAIVAIGYRAHPLDAVRSDERYRRENKCRSAASSGRRVGMMQVMMFALTVHWRTATWTSTLKA